MFSPAGQAALHGGSRSTYTGRSLADRARARAAVHQIRQRRHVARRTAHASETRRRPALGLLKPPSILGHHQEIYAGRPGGAACAGPG